MPKPVTKRLAEQLQAKGMPRDKAYAVATRKMQQAGNIDAHGKQTAQGARRAEMGAKGRAIDRAARASGHKPDEFAYSSRTNRATLKRK